jgi:hypothetical protein
MALGTEQEDEFELPEEGAATAGAEAEAGEGDDEDGEEVVTFGDADVTPEPETPVIRQLREAVRASKRELAELRRTAPAPAQAEKIIVGERPKIEDLDWDQERFDAETDAWLARRDAAAKQEDAARQAEQAQHADVDKARQAYFQQKSALPYADAQDAEDAAFGELDGVQQMIIAKYAAKPALFIYALGKNPTKLAQVSAETDLIKLGILISKMEATLTTARRRAPDPEQVVTGGRTAALGTTDKHLEKLEKEATRTGDRSALIAYKASKKA